VPFGAEWRLQCAESLDGESGDQVIIAGGVHCVMLRPLVGGMP
jgi:hypothetical protein